MSDSAIIPALCTNCHFLFSARTLTFVDCKNVYLEGNQEKCPNCGKLANIIDGTFNILNGALELISGPDISREMLFRFAQLVNRAIEKEITPDELEVCAGELDVRFAELVRKIKAPHIGLILLLFWLKGCHSNIDVKLDLNQMFEQIRSGYHVEQTQPTGDAQHSQPDKPGSPAYPTRKHYRPRT